MINFIMTRINCVPVQELSKEHLLAEYRELPRVRHAYPRKTPPNIPSTYRMGKGHVTFFFDKGIWLEKRHSNLVDEMRRRGYKTNIPRLRLSHWKDECMNNWTPDENDLLINRRRIKERSG